MNSDLFKIMAKNGSFFGCDCGRTPNGDENGEDANEEEDCFDLPKPYEKNILEKLQSMPLLPEFYNVGIFLKDQAAEVFGTLNDIKTAYRGIKSKE